LGLSEEHYEAIVIGSGFGGAVAACRLAQAGVSVAVLERGRRYERGEFPRPEHGRHDLMDWRRGGPYDIRPLNDVLVVQGAGYGGGSLIYANVQMRPPADAFDRGWPTGYTRASLDPYYDLVAHMLDIRPVEPDPATGALPAKTTLVEDAASRLGRRAQTFRPNIAVRFEGAGQPPVPNRFGAPQSGCMHCGECDIGCNVAAKNTLDLNYLAVAESMGAHVGTKCEATRITPVETGFALDYRDLAEGRDRTVTAQEVFLCLGAVNSTELLLRCRDQYRTLPRLSSKLGTGFSANGDFLALGLGVSPPFRAMHGPTITTACIFDRRDADRRTWFVVEDGGYTTYVAHLLPALSPMRLARVLGRELQGVLSHQAESFADLLEREGDATAIFLVMGRDSADGRIELARPGHRLHVHWDTASNRPLYAAEIAACRELVTAMGGRLSLMPNWRFLGQPSSVHNLGGCRMADGERDGVVDADGRVFGYPGLYVLDGAIVPAALGANPSHTIAAVAERCIETAIRRLPGRERWRAPQRADAVRLVPPEDSVLIPPTGTVAPVAAGGGLRWHEVMRGELTLAGVTRSARVEIAITVVDARSFVSDPAHPGLVDGAVHVDGLAPPAGARIGGGSFHLFLDEGDSQARAMRYTLPFHDVDGRPWTLHGVKDVRGHSIVDFLRSTTTLGVRLEQAEGDNEPGVGTLRISPVDVTRLLASIRPSGRGAGRIAGLWRFVRFYATTILRLYVAGKRRRGP
jgi:cholesterol oxidase